MKINLFGLGEVLHLINRFKNIEKSQGGSYFPNTYKSSKKTNIAFILPNTKHIDR